MPDRPAPYVKKDPGDIIYSGDWNELQIQAREEIYKEVRGHRHTSGDDGRPVPREGIEPNAIDGSRIDPTTDATVEKLTVSSELRVDGKAILGNRAIVEKLTVSSELRVDGKAILGDIADLLGKLQGLGDGIDALNKRVDGLDRDKLSASGGLVNGSLTVAAKNEHLTLRREKQSTGSKRVFLELRQDDPKTPEVFPSIRFHHEGKYWHRLETRKDGFHFKHGDLKSEDYRPLFCSAVKIGNALVTTANENLHFIRGYVNVNGSVLAGSGFSVTHTATGMYTITFVRAFSARPTVVCTQHYPASDSFRNTGGDTRDNAVVIAVNKNQCLIKTGGASGNASNRRFEFIAVGPR